MPDYLSPGQDAHHRRLARFALCVTLVFGALIARLGYLQTARHDELSRAAADNYTKDERLYAERGTIYDRNGRVLATNRPSFDLFVTPRDVRDVDALVEALTPVLEFDKLGQLELRELLKTREPYARRTPTRVARDLATERVALAEEAGRRFGGVSVEVKRQRTYPQGALGAHAVGYLGHPSAQDLRERGVAPGEMVGRFGVERLYDSSLRGAHGYQRFVVDARGRRATAPWAAGATLRVGALHEPVPGSDLRLTIDARVQEIAYNAMEGYESGAVVVMDPRTGELLAMVSKPTFDPNIWSGRLTAAAKREVDENPYNPLLDKSVKSYFPGSLYKIVTAVAAMEEGVLDPEQPIDSPGAYEYGNRVFHCHKRSGHGRVDLNGAMAASADVYFYKLGEKMGIDTLAVYGKHFGFGEQMLALNGESAGVVPTRSYHEQHSPGGFQHGLSLSSAIGQGAVRTSPLQMAVAFSALANHGVVYRPQLLLETRRGGDEVTPHDPSVMWRLPASPAHIHRVRRSLERAVNDPKRATGYRAAVPMGRVAGKTGTAQVKSLSRGARSAQGDQRWEHQDHAWFAAFAPYESPRLTVVVFLEHGGSGGKDAAPVARKVFEAFHQEIEPIFDAQAPIDLPYARLP